MAREAYEGYHNGRKTVEALAAGDGWGAAYNGALTGLNLFGVKGGAPGAADDLAYAKNAFKAKLVAPRRVPVASVSGVGDDFVTVFRGDRPGTAVIKSHAAREGGYAHSQRLIDEGNLDDLFRSHAADSMSPASPFISVTTDRRVAEFFAGPNGVVSELRIPVSRATPNPHNNLVVPAGPGGHLIPESELLVPNYIRPSEILRRTKR